MRNPRNPFRLSSLKRAYVDATEQKKYQKAVKRVFIRGVPLQCTMDIRDKALVALAIYNAMQPEEHKKVYLDHAAVTVSDIAEFMFQYMFRRNNAKMYIIAGLNSFVIDILMMCVLHVPISDAILAVVAVASVVVSKM